MRLARVLGVLWICTVAGCFAGTGVAQDPAAEKRARAMPSGSVRGDVFDAGLNTPVRFAQIRLVPKPKDMDAATSTERVQMPEQPSMPEVALVGGTSGMDGRFQIEGVPAGEYFLAAIEPGYVTPGEMAIKDFTSTAEQLKKAAAEIGMVQVVADGVAQVHLRLQRGGVIEGRVQYGDGSPAILVRVDAEAAKITIPGPEARNRVVSPLQVALQQMVMMGEGSRTGFTTDDQGRFRIFGLAPGRYVLSSILGLDHSAGHIELTGGGGGVTKGRDALFPEIIPVYAPGVFSRERAKVVDVHADEVVTGIDLTIDPSHVHTVRGKVTAMGDGHAPNGGAMLKEHGSSAPARMTMIEEDGSFQINYLPAGTYDLEIVARDTVAMPGTGGSGGFQGMAFYKTVKQTVIVGDDDVNLKEIQVTRLKPGEMPEPSTL